jgi:branched-chain amino acid transport system substrate-binding protein
VNNVSASAAVLRPVGFKNVQGVVSATYFKDPADPQWANDPETKTYTKAMHKCAPGPDPPNQFTPTAGPSPPACTRLWTR